MKIAIILSVYHNDKLAYLQEAIESLAYEEVDILIQQDGIVSPEVENYLDELLRQKTIVYLGKRKENKGLAFSLNELIEFALKSKYNYIARMDADDISVKGRIKLQYAFMQQNLEIDVVGGYIEEFSTEIEYNKIVKYPLVHDEMFRFFSKRVPLAHVTAMYRSSFFEKAGFYPTSSLTNEDTLMWMQGFSSGCRFANISHILVKVRVSKSFFNRRGGLIKAWNDFKDRGLVIRTLGYNNFSYFYAGAMFIVNIVPAKLKQFLYERLR